MAVTIPPQLSSEEKLWPSPYSPTAILSTANPVPQPASTQARSSIDPIHPQQITTPPSAESKAPANQSQIVNGGTKEKNIRLWPSPYSSGNEETTLSPEQPDPSRDRINETPDRESGKGVEVPAKKRSLLRRLWCFG